MEIKRYVCFYLMHLSNLHRRWLENVKKIKYLGVILDSGMTWGEHCV